MGLGEVNLIPEGGVGSTYRVMGRVFLLFHMEWTMTREEYVPVERFVEHANTGGGWTLIFEPDETGTVIEAAFGWSSKVPFMAELMERGWNGDSDLDAMLANLRQAIET